MSVKQGDDEMDELARHRWSFERSQGTPHSPPRLTPMLAKTGDVPRDKEAYAYEFKWDGVRALVHADHGMLRVTSRNDHDLTAQFPEFVPLPRSLLVRNVVLDGEIVAIDPRTGRPDFGLLQKRLNLTSPHAVQKRAADVPVVFFVFDLLWLDGHDLTGHPYEERRAQLLALDLNSAAWSTPVHHLGDPEALLVASREHGLEGIIAKRRDAPYRSGKRTEHWVKIKNRNRQEFVVGGWTLGKGGRAGTIGALLLGHYEEGRLRYAGRVGSGFTDPVLERIRAMLEPIATGENPFVNKREVPPEARFVRPKLVVDVEFAGWTHDDHLRQTSFKGLRHDKEPHEVVREPDVSRPIIGGEQHA